MRDNYTYILLLKNRTKLFVVVCLTLFSSVLAIAQAKQLKVKFNFIVDGGSRDGSKVSIERDGQKWRTRDGDDGKNYIDLDYQHDYIFSFSKNGYVTKKIAFSTKVPKSIIKDGFDPFSFDISIFKQSDAINIVMFNQPVARIEYKEDIDDFGYDTDYTKSVLSGIQDAEKELKKKTKEEKANPKSGNVTSTGPGSQANQSAETANKNSSEGGSNSTETTKKSGNEGDKKSNTPFDNDARNKSKSSTDPGDRGKTSGQTDGGNRNVFNGKTPPEKREERQYVEGNKRITEITIVRNGKTYVYKKVCYVWGVFYFRDNVNITETIFIEDAL